MNEFKTASMDGTTKMITIVIVLFLIIFPILSFSFDPPKPIISITSMILMYGVIIISYCFVPKRIALSDNQVLIKNLYGSVIINLSDIQSFGKIEKTGLNLRTFGVGGLFGYFGYFNGGDVWYVTNTHKKVKIILNSGKVYMISPESPDDFLTQLKQRMEE